MSRVSLTTNQRRGFLAAWGGWVLDGMDSFIYALVMVPALRELLPLSGIPGDQANVGFYGGLLFALFLVHMGELFALNPQSGGWAIELQAMFLFTAIALALLGPGRFSLNQK